MRYPRRTITITLLLLILFLAQAQAGDNKAKPEKAGWSENFQVDGKKIAIEAISKSGDPLEDDMSINVIQNGKTISLPVKEGLYELSAASSDKESLGNRLPVFRIGPQEVLLILTLNKRPTFPKTTLVVFDYASQKVIDVKEEVATFRQESLHSRYAVLSAGAGSYRIRLVKEVLQISDGPEAYIDAWMVIRYDRKKLNVSWE